MTFLTSSVEVHSLVNIANYSPGATFGPRVMTSFEFVWVLEGSAAWSILGANGEVVEANRLVPGVMALSSIGSSERYEWDPAQASAHAFVHFELPAGIDASGWPRTRTVSDCPPLGALADSLFDLAVTDECAARGRSSLVIGLMLEVFLAGPIPRPDGHPPHPADRRSPTFGRSGHRVACGSSRSPRSPTRSASRPVTSPDRSATDSGSGRPALSSWCGWPARRWRYSAHHRHWRRSQQCAASPTSTTFPGASPACTECRPEPIGGDIRTPSRSRRSSSVGS
jgi:hypothetical protein